MLKKYYYLMFCSQWEENRERRFHIVFTQFFIQWEENRKRRFFFSCFVISGKRAEFSGFVVSGKRAENRVFMRDLQYRDGATLTLTIKCYQPNNLAHNLEL
jgi:hypothetical protein